MRADKLRNRQKIVEKAKEMLESGNLDTISLEEIAEASEVTRATLYNHFPAREDLLREMVLPALDFITSELKDKNRQGGGDLSVATSSLFNLYQRFRETLELASCRTLSGDKDVEAAHGAFLKQFKAAMTAAGAADFPLGEEMSIRLISATYLPVLRELHRSGRLEFPLFHEIMEGVINL